MSAKNNLHRIFSVSAASAALLQSTDSTRCQSAGVSNESDAMPKEKIISKTDNLILAPPHQNKLLQLYADHTSHASHSSHVSGASDYSTPSPIPATTPIYQPSPTPVSSSVSTNAASTTNTPTAQELAADKSLIEFLTKEAAKGSANAQYSLGICYLYGSRGVPKNLERAKMLLELSAVQENIQAKERLEELKQAENKSATSNK